MSSLDSRSGLKSWKQEQTVERRFPAANSAAVEVKANQFLDDIDSDERLPMNTRFAADEPVGRACFEMLRRQNRVGVYTAPLDNAQQVDETIIRPAAVRDTDTYYFTPETGKSHAKGIEEIAPAGESEIPCISCVDWEFKTVPEIIGATTGGRGQLKNFNEDPNSPNDSGFRWGPAVKQSMMFLGVQLGFTLVTQPKTRYAVSNGNFFVDYYRSVKSLRGWDDQGRFFTNYIAHPMQGALTGFIHVQNDPKGIKQQFGASKSYWRSRSYAFLWSTFWSTQFEIGLVSQASIGNIGLAGKQTWGDIVVTPTAGTAWLIAEDAIDRYITRHIEGKNLYLRALLRLILNPVRSSANLLRFKEPWYRDRPLSN